MKLFRRKKSPKNATKVTANSSNAKKTTADVKTGIDLKQLEHWERSSKKGPVDVDDVLLDTDEASLSSQEHPSTKNVAKPVSKTRETPVAKVQAPQDAPQDSEPEPLKEQLQANPNLESKKSTQKTGPSPSVSKKAPKKTKSSSISRAEQPLTTALAEVTTSSSLEKEPERHAEKPRLSIKIQKPRLSIKIDNDEKSVKSVDPSSSSNKHKMINFLRKKSPKNKPLKEKENEVPNSIGTSSSSEFEVLSKIETSVAPVTGQAKTVSRPLLLVSTQKPATLDISRLIKQKNQVKKKPPPLVLKPLNPNRARPVSMSMSRRNEEQFQKYVQRQNRGRMARAQVRTL